MTPVCPPQRADGSACTLGVLGGGQLGRMFAQAAQSLGYAVAVLDPDANSPAAAVAQHHLRADYLDAVALAELGARCDAVTTEFENVPAQALRQLADLRRVAPSADAVAVCQDRAREKRHFEQAGVVCAPYAVLTVDDDLDGVGPELLPGILKTAQLGYDGKGQRRVRDRAELSAAWADLGQVPCVLEAQLALAHEVSVIVARGSDDTIVHLPVQHNLHREGVLAVTEVPAGQVSAAQQQQAIDCAVRIARTLDYVGVLCVEFFVLADGSLCANEMAPRPHNSGHYSIDACDVSQFELQVRTLTGLPLTQPRLHSPALMLNLMGDLWFDAVGAERSPDWPALLALPGVHLHLYGKTQARRGRKMGHLTVTAENAEQARRTAAVAAALLGIAPF